MGKLVSWGNWSLKMMEKKQEQKVQDFFTKEFVILILIYNE